MRVILWHQTQTGDKTFNTEDLTKLHVLSPRNKDWKYYKEQIGSLEKNIVRKNETK